MQKSIRKHPFAFIHALAWLGLGLTMAYVARHIDDAYEQVPLADAAVIFGTLCAVLIPVTMIAGIIALLVRRKGADVRKEKTFLQKVCYDHLRTDQKAKRAHDTLLCFAAGLILLPFVLVAVFPSLIDYTAALLFCTIGVIVWLWVMNAEMPKARLTKVQPDEFCFQITPGMTDTQFETLKKEGSLYGIPKHLWNGRKVYLYNMLLKDKLISEHTAIPCYDLPLDQMRQRLQLPAEGEKDEEVIWVHLKPFFPSESSSSTVAIASLFTYRFADLLRSRYEHNTSTDAADYDHHSSQIQLDMTAEAQLLFSEGRPYLFCPQTYSLADDDDKLYLGCMLQIDGAHLERVMYDHFNTWTDPEASTKYDLSPEERDTFYRLMREGVLDYTVETLDYHPFEDMLAISIWGEPVEDGQGQVFFTDDGTGYAIILRYSRLTWHWMATVDMD